MTKATKIWTVTYDDERGETRRIIQTWTDKENAKDYAKELKKIFDHVLIRPYPKVKHIKLSTDD